MSTPLWPFITIRHNFSGAACPQLMTRLLDISAEHPGSCDDAWLCYAYGASAEQTRKEAALALPIKAHCDALGIRCSFQ